MPQSCAPAYPCWEMILGKAKKLQQPPKQCRKALSTL
jgi:hypothetical protein